MTLPELLEKLRDVDEVQLMEWLEIRSSDLVDRFPDFIEDAFDMLLNEIEELDYGTDD